MGDFLLLKNKLTMDSSKGCFQFFLAFIFASFGFLSFDNYFNPKKEEIHNYEQLIKEGVETTATLDSSYTETSVLGASVFSVDYQFTVQNRQYNGYYTFDKIEDIKGSTIPVRYLKNNPSINSANPEKHLENANNFSKSKFWLVAGLVFGLAAIGSGMSGRALLSK